MSVNLNALNQYKTVDLRATVETASPHKLISMLLEGATEALAKANGAVDRNNIEERTRSLNKASEIIVNLKASLDEDKGGELAQNLSALYDYMIQTIYEANRDNSAEKIKEVIQLMSEIRQGWAGIPPELQDS